jgi:hypothetical protein
MQPSTAVRTIATVVVLVLAAGTGTGGIAFAQETATTTAVTPTTTTAQPTTTTAQPTTTQAPTTEPTTAQTPTTEPTATQVPTTESASRTATSTPTDPPAQTTTDESLRVGSIVAPSEEITQRRYGSIQVAYASTADYPTISRIVLADHDHDAERFVWNVEPGDVVNRSSTKIVDLSFTDWDESSVDGSPNFGVYDSTYSVQVVVTNDEGYTQTLETAGEYVRVDSKPPEFLDRNFNASRPRFQIEIVDEPAFSAAPGDQVGLDPDSIGVYIEAGGTVKTFRPSHKGVSFDTATNVLTVDPRIAGFDADEHSVVVFDVNASDELGNSDFTGSLDYYVDTGDGGDESDGGSTTTESGGDSNTTTEENAGSKGTATSEPTAGSTSTTTAEPNTDENAGSTGGANRTTTAKPTEGTGTTTAETTTSSGTTTTHNSTATSEADSANVTTTTDAVSTSAQGSTTDDTGSTGSDSDDQDTSASSADGDSNGNAAGGDAASSGRSGDADDAEDEVETTAVQSATSHQTTAVDAAASKNAYQGTQSATDTSGQPRSPTTTSNGDSPANTEAATTTEAYEPIIKSPTTTARGPGFSVLGALGGLLFGASVLTRRSS